MVIPHHYYLMDVFPLLYKVFRLFSINYNYTYKANARLTTICGAVGLGHIEYVYTEIIQLVDEYNYLYNYCE